MLTKICSRCRLEMSTAHFHANKAMADGLHFYCMECNKSAAKERRERSREMLASARDVSGFLRSAQEQMDARGISRAALAKAIGVKPDTVGAWFRGEKKPHPATQVMAGRHLDVALNHSAFLCDEQGDYPDGMGLCGVCDTEFSTYRKKFALFCSRTCASKAQSTRQFGENNPAYKNGRKMTDQGYVQVLVDRSHPMAARGGYALEHRLVMSEYLGRPLARYEVVHHINGDRTDNRIENLELCGKDDARHPPGQRMRDVLLSVSKHPSIAAMPESTQKAIAAAMRDVLQINGLTN